ncbi:MAG: tRNA pseudouridine synthase B [Candidatus Anoxychlamydiales bacterium]|uniref:tRNA pseudouridine(55) synthase n=1 Tax=marine sediment metagenome TaxID=412755 RepID=A0A0F9GCB0_9ZZZZ|nr:tRNA pseudouridine synthase B [Candidatus Anoxychlamydiales bacterium]NGX41306.1 tRNA pseudouridine synthase B [Candidatus Anoxychlamydiales bacterium]HEU63912.1 tRNA pseudouridine(55) synthase TruB [Chlamydiota bacterium]
MSAMNENFGILLVNKSKNKTSFSLVSLLRKLTKIKKIGHAGTLDPFATGLMIMLIGKEYTQKSSNFITFDKTYVCRLHLGYTTKTFDTEAEKVFHSKKEPTIQEVEEVLKEFQGDIEQTPPMFSAKKVNGQRLYKLARQGLSIKREKIKINVKTTLLSFEYPYIDLEITCSKGTYIRTIANDIGEKLKTGAYLITLTRTRCGPYFLKDATPQENLDENVNLSGLLIK